MRLYDVLTVKPTQHYNEFNQISVALRFLTDFGIRVAFAPGSTRIHIGFTPSGRVPIRWRLSRNGE